MIKSFFQDKKWRLWSWGGLFILIISLWLQVSLTVAINTWYGGFYDLLQNAADYKDKPLDGIKIFYDKLVSVKYITKDPGVNPLMGWESSTDTLTELKLEFSSKDKAIEYAKKNKIKFEIIESKEKQFIKKSYADNFTK